MNRTLILLRILLLSTSQRNIYRYSKDRKKRRKIVGGTVGTVILYVLLIAFCIAMCIGYGQSGLIESAPVMCALLISVLAFVFTLLKTNGYLFNFREYDMLMSLPFETRTVAACKFLYMYIKSLPWYGSISVAMLAGYGFYARPAFYVYPVWILLSFILPIIPMLIAAFLGFLVARVSSGFRRTNLIQTVLTMCIVIFSFAIRFILEDMFKNNKVQQTLETASEMTGNAGRIYLPAGWFSNAVTKSGIVDLLLLAVVSAVLFAVVFRIVGSSYRNINSAMKSHAAAKNYRMKAQKKRSVVTSIAFKEFRRLTGSTVYMVNTSVGEVLALLVGILTLIIGFDRIVSMVTNGAPIDTSILHPAIPFVVYFFIGMLATTACSPSLEGKNYWIVQSLPIEKKTLYQGKMLFNLCLTVPFMIISMLCLCISARVPAVDTVLYLLLGIALCFFSTAWGCACGVKHMRLDWENEVEVVKQGAAVTIYMLPNLFVTMGLVVLMVILGIRMDHRILAVIMTLIAGTLAVLSYLRVMSLAKEGSAQSAKKPKPARRR